MFFSECDNYIDGGVICNNPTEYGLTTIQNFFRQQGKKLPIALVVSIGTGVYPAVELGSIDLFLGIQTLTRIKQTAQNLISLLGNAVCPYFTSMGSGYLIDEIKSGSSFDLWSPLKRICGSKAGVV